MPHWLYLIDDISWVLSSVLIIYSSIILVVFVVFYYIVYDVKSTTAGKFIFRFVLSLIGVIALVFIGAFIDPAHGRSWTHYPGDVVYWRPILRVIIYAYVAFSASALVILLALRRWKPYLLRTALDRELVRTRKEDHI